MELIITNLQGQDNKPIKQMRPSKPNTRHVIIPCTPDLHHGRDNQQTGRGPVEANCAATGSGRWIFQQADYPPGY